MEIRPYSDIDALSLFDIMREEGPDWECYYGEVGRDNYKKALENSITYTAYEGEKICGYLRCRDDDGFGIYVYDLLVKKSCRGQSIGRELMEHIWRIYPQDGVYVLSGADEYYIKLGYHREGTIFKVNTR